jgi:molybdate/tungstate transport system ATP-binding protein
MIRADALQVRAGGFALGPVDLAVADGEYLAVVGPSGAGKSVLLEALAGLRPAAAGRVAAGERDVTGAPPERRGIGLVGQRPLLFPHLTVARNIAFGPSVGGGGLARWTGGRGGARNYAAADRDARVHEVAAALGVVALLGRPPGSLSGGECQRVALARALAARPRALLLDEPLSALDPEAREELQAELRRVHERFAMTTIHVTHSLDEALAVARRCVVLIAGRIAQDGPIDEVVAHPATPAVARLTGARNVLPATARPTSGGSGGSSGSCEVTLAGGLMLRARSAARGAVTVIVRADAIVVRPARPAPGGRPEADPPNVNVVTARVTAARATSTGCLVSVDAAGLTALVPRAYGDGFEAAPGAAVELVIPVECVHVIPAEPTMPAAQALPAAQAPPAAATPPEDVVSFGHAQAAVAAPEHGASVDAIPDRQPL